MSLCWCLFGACMMSLWDGTCLLRALLRRPSEVRFKVNILDEGDSVTVFIILSLQA